MRLRKTLFWWLVVLLPTQLTYYFWPQSALIFGIRIDYLAPVVFLTDVLLIALLTVWLLEKRRRIKPGKWFWGITTFAILNTIFAPRWQVAAFNWLKIAEMTGLAFYVYKNKKEVLVGMRKPLTIAVGYTAVLALVQLVRQRTVGGPFYFLGERTFGAGTPGIALFNLAGKSLMRPYATFGHPNAMAGFVLASIPFLLPAGRILGMLTTIISFSGLTDCG